MGKDIEHAYYRMLLLNINIKLINLGVVLSNIFIILLDLKYLQCTSLSLGAELSLTSSSHYIIKIAYSICIQKTAYFLQQYN